MYHPPGREFRIGRWLGIEFATELLEAIIAVFLLSRTRLVTFGARVGFITTAGILAAFATNISYWNWYGFPGSLHSRLHVHSNYRVCLCRNCRRAGVRQKQRTFHFGIARLPAVNKD
jgi:hypothetical protein